MYKKLFFIAVLIINFSCKDIIDEVRINDDTVALLAPSDAAIMSNTDVSFAWNTVAGASEYVIQIATPNFTTPMEIVIDSTVTTSNFSIALLATTDYEWRVKAKNENYQTKFSTRSLAIE